MATAFDLGEERDNEALVSAILAVAGETSTPVVLRRLVEAACELTGARYGALGVIGPDGALSEFVYVGITADEAAEIGDLPVGEGILGLLIARPLPLRLDDLTVHGESVGFPAGHPPMHSFLGVPVRVRGEAFGNLYLTEKVGGGSFTEGDERRAMVLATVAGAVIENSRRVALAREFAVLEDRERIARDLHDTVIQRLFASGMALQGATRRIADDVARAKVTAVVDALDETIREIRSVIFAVSAASRSVEGLRSDVLAVCAEAANALGFDPSVRFDGPVDAAITEGLGDHVLAVVREGLVNSAKHAQALSAQVTVQVRDGWVRVAVRDDGRGPDGESGPGGRKGLGNLRSRAEALGGRLVFAATEPVGSELRWEVPLG
ncbi:MAG: GAF domain-containing sensor histidine kinase [Acidimicrobiales bacterium]